MLHRLKPIVERFPSLAFAYRTIRDTREMRRQKPRVTPQGFKMVGNTAMQAGSFEPEETGIIQSFLAAADVFVDVGANIGYYTCLSRSVGKHTIAVEPLSQNLNYLYANLHENGWNDIEVYPVGLARQPGLAILYGASTGASLVSGWAGASRLLQRTIPISTLDILVGSRFDGKQLVIKIDVEGAEYAVLKGALTTLTMTPRPVWVIEICLSEHHPAGLNPDYLKTFDLLWRSGYQARTADRLSRAVSPDDVQRWVKAGRCEYDSINYVWTSTAFDGTGSKTLP